MKLSEKAFIYATAAHGSINQKRKTGGDYIVHPIAVAEIVKTVTDNEDMIAAAYLHDVIEDVNPIKPNLYHMDGIERSFGRKVAALVFDLTNMYSKSRFPNLNRKERKKLENDRIKIMDVDAKTIKLADILDNCKDLKNLGEFGEIYKKEKQEQLECLKGGDSKLWNDAYELLYDKKFGMKVKELIDLLSKEDPEMMLVTAGYEGGYHGLSDIQKLKLKLNQNTEWYYGKHEQVLGNDPYDVIALHLS